MLRIVLEIAIHLNLKRIKGFVGEIVVINIGILKKYKYVNY